MRHAHPHETPGRWKRRATDLAIAAALREGASLRLAAALFGVSPAKVWLIKMQYFGRGPIERQPERPRA